MHIRDSEARTARIINCLQTILELEPLLRRMDAGNLLVSEFKVLKAFLSEMNEAPLDEDDVARIEKATERFLYELKSPVSLFRQIETNNIRLQ